MSKRPSTDNHEGLANKKAKPSSEDSSAFDYLTQDSNDESFVGFQENEINKVKYFKI